jgi:MFS family permease
LAQSADAALPDEAAPSASGRFHTFRALRNPSYRYFWTGQIGHSASIWMEQVIRPLLMLELTDSPFQVGLVVAIRTAPLLVFGLFAGVIVDRYNKHQILMWSQVTTLLMHLALGLLLVTGLVQIWHIFATAFVSGAASAFNQPARQTILPRLVPRADLLNALGLNQAALNTTRIAGAGLAGLLLVFIDYGEIYLLNALIYAGVIWTTLRVVVKDDKPSSRQREPLLRDFVEGFRYIGENRRVLYLVGMAMVVYIFGLPYQQVSIPLLAVDVLQIGRTGVGSMLAMTGIGALIGSLLIASRDRVEGRERIMLGMLVCFSLALIVLAQSHWLALSTLALLVGGAMTTSYFALNNTLIFEETPPEYHGRVISLMNLDRGLIPLGAILSGFLAERLNPSLGLTIMALAGLGLTLLASILMPGLGRRSS